MYFPYPALRGRSDERIFSDLRNQLMQIEARGRDLTSQKTLLQQEYREASQRAAALKVKPPLPATEEIIILPDRSKPDVHIASFW